MFRSSLGLKLSALHLFYNLDNEKLDISFFARAIGHVYCLCVECIVIFSCRWSQENAALAFSWWGQGEASLVQSKPVRRRFIWRCGWWMWRCIPYSVSFLLLRYRPTGPFRSRKSDFELLTFILGSAERSPKYNGGFYVLIKVLRSASLLA